MREATIMVRARWTARRARLWWDHLVAQLLELAAAQLGVAIAAVVWFDLERPPERSWSRRKWALVRVHLVYLVGAP